MASTLLLDTSAWDLVLDASGNIAVATAPYQIAQDVACALRLFEGELYYDTSVGVPYWAVILEKAPPISILKAEFVKAARRVPEVVEAVCFLSSVQDRKLGGQVQVSDQTGKIQVIPF